jgi:hypothetical protein
MNSHQQTLENLKILVDLEKKNNRKIETEIQGKK